MLFIGDIVGQPGRRAVKELVPQLRQQHGLHLVVANGENSAGGSGITVKTAEEIFAAGTEPGPCSLHQGAFKRWWNKLFHRPRERSPN